MKDRQTDRQTDKQTNSLTPYTGVCGIFLSVKFATSLFSFLAGGLSWDRFNNVGVDSIIPYKYECKACLNLQYQQTFRVLLSINLEVGPHFQKSAISLITKLFLVFDQYYVSVAEFVDMVNSEGQILNNLYYKNMDAKNSVI